MRLLAVGLVMVAMGCAADIVLPGEPAERAPVGYAPFPDRLSAYVWRNWFCVPKERLAEVVGATAEQLKALEDKAAGNVRCGISNASSLGQHLALAAYADKGYARQKRQKYDVLRRRYMAIRRLLAENPGYAEFFEPMPFNSGYFMCVKPKGVDAEEVRRHLVAKYSTGVIVLSGLVRLAFSTVPVAKLPRLFANVAAAIADLQKKKEK